MRRRIVIRHKGMRARMCVFATVGEKGDGIEERMQALLSVQRLDAMWKIATAAQDERHEAESSCGAAAVSAEP